MADTLPGRLRRLEERPHLVHDQPAPPHPGTKHLVLQAGQYAEEIAEIEALTGFIAALEGAIRTQIRERSEAVIGDISDNLNAMWEVLHPGEPIDNVKLIVPDNDKAIDVGLSFHGQEQDLPRLTLSEGYRKELLVRAVSLAMASWGWREGSTAVPR